MPFSQPHLVCMNLPCVPNAYCDYENSGDKKKTQLFVSQSAPNVRKVLETIIHYL